MSSFIFSLLRVFVALECLTLAVAWGMDPWIVVLNAGVFVFQVAFLAIYT